MLVEYIMPAIEPSTSDYTVVMAQTPVVVVVVVVVQTASPIVDVVRTVIKVVVVPPVVAVVVSILFDGPLPLHSTCPLFYLGVDHMHDNPYLHAQQTDKMCSINSSTS